MLARYFHEVRPWRGLAVLRGAVWLCWIGLSGGAFGAERFALPEFLLRSWNDDDGLPPAAVRAIARTPDGYLWVGTEGGLARFDGVRFVTATTNDIPTLGDDNVSALLVDGAGDLWVGTRGGSLARRHGGVFSSVPSSPELPGRPINALAQDGSGAIWGATTGAGLWRWQGGSLESFRRTNGLPADGALTVVADKQGRVWAVSGGKLISFAEGRWGVAGVTGMVSAPVVAMSAARDGGLWVATSAKTSANNRGGRVFKLKDGARVSELGPYPWPQDTYHTSIRIAFEDQAGRLWVGMMGAGSYFWEPEAGWRSPGTNASFSQVLVNCVSDDDAGNLWVGLDGAQLDQLRSRPVTTLHLPATASQHVIRMVAAARDGSMWVGTDGDGVFRLRDGSFTGYASEQGLTNGFIGVILEDRRTNLWIGTWGGLFRLKGERFEAVTDPPALRGVVRALLEDRAGNLWVGTSVGVVVLPRSGQSGLVAGPDSYIGAQVLAIEQDAAGTVWATSSRRGLFRLTGRRFERFESDPWGGRAEVCSLHADAEGGLWAGTLASGLAYIKDGRSTRWSSKDGLPSDGIRAIMEDVEGNLWFGSDNGIFGCPAGRLKSFERGVSEPLLFWQLSTAEGLDTRRCSGTGQPVAARSADGKLWFPNWRALAVFDPAQARRNSSPRPAVIEEVLVDNAAQAADLDQVLRVKSSARSFEFHYTSPNLESPERVRFRYQLKGADSGWVEAEQRRVAYYGRLSPGQYDFRVMAGGPSGVWQKAAQELRLVVVPQIWERRSVQVAGALGLIVAVATTVWGLERARSRRRLQRIEAHQAMERERQRIARDLHDDLGGDLTEIMLLGELAAQPNASAETRSAHAGSIAARSRQAAAAMDQIVWTVNPRNDSVPRLADRLAEAARRLFDPLPVELRVEIMEDIPALPLPANARHALFLAAKEAQHNAAKHSGATEVRVGVWCERGRLILTVEDNGRGFDPASQSGSRNGLENMRQRMESIGGSFALSSQPGQGTKVRLEFPLSDERKT